MPSAFNIIRSFTKLPHSLRFASFGVATAALRLRPDGFVKLALCLAPLRNCEKRYMARLERLGSPARQGAITKATSAPRRAAALRRQSEERQGFTANLHAWSGVFIQRARARKQKPGKSNPAAG